MTTENLILSVFKDLIAAGRMDVVTNPEFLEEEFTMANLLKPHLIVIGLNRRQSSRILETYYEDFYKTLPEIMHISISTAELIKYANNTFLVTKISFINSMAMLCQEISGYDVNTVMHAVGKDPCI